jgi:hypothetical protein
MDTLGIWMNLTAALTKECDWKSICKLSIAFGNEYIDYYNKEMPKPTKRGDVLKIRVHDCGEDINVSTCVVANITKKKNMVSLELHYLVCSEDDTVLACPLIRVNNRSIPSKHYIMLEPSDLFCGHYKQEHFFGSIEFTKIM